VLKRRRDAAQSTYSACQAFLDELPDDATLGPVEVKVEGHNLKEVRARLAIAQAELKTLRALPTSSADIKERIERYVAEMARPTITGIGKGERLKVFLAGLRF
jgi:hypothetical protein